MPASESQRASQRASAIVTGGAGFIGSHVVDALIEQGFAVTVIDDLSSGRAELVNESASLREVDIVRREQVQAVFDDVMPTAVFHLAAQASVTASVTDPFRDLQVNVAGTLNVLAAAADHAAPLVFTSTGGALYGDDAPLPTSEVQPPSPLSPYGAAKLAAEAYVRTWSLSHDVPNAICRLGNVYGPRQSPHGEAGVVAIFSHHLYEGRAPTIFGHGTPTRDYVYVTDVVAALLAASGKRGIYNVATSVETDVMTLWRSLKSCSESSIEPQLADLRPGELKRSCLDAGLAERELGWRAQVPIADGLAQTYDALTVEFERAATKAAR